MIVNAPGKLTVNPGHGPKDDGTFDPGAIGPTGLKESTQNREIGDLVVADMCYNKWQVLDIQDGDLDDVTDASNKWVPQYFLSIHADSVSDPTAHGITTYVQGLGGWAERIAKEVQKEMVLATGLSDRGVRVSNLHVTRETDGPALLVECGFISNSNEEALMKSPAWDKLMAGAICKGFSRAVDVPYTPMSTPVTSAPVPSPSVSDPDVNLIAWVAASKAPAAIKSINALGFYAEQFPLKLRRD
jgi:N-acetylmuramoyl-L-alanine amidase